MHRFNDDSGLAYTRYHEDSYKLHEWIMDNEQELIIEFDKTHPESNVYVYDYIHAHKLYGTPYYVCLREAIVNTVALRDEFKEWASQRFHSERD